MTNSTSGSMETVDSGGAMDNGVQGSGRSGDGTPRRAFDLRRTIEHTYLKPEGAAAAVARLCAEARAEHLFGVCVNPAYVRVARAELAGSGVRVVTVCGFPLGASDPAAKAYEAGRAVADGADEVDMVANLGWCMEDAWEQVEADVRAVVDAVTAAPAPAGGSGESGMAHAGTGRVGVPVKVILETALLAGEARIRRASRAALAGGAAFLKTSTGFGPGGATPEHVGWLREAFAAASTDDPALAEAAANGCAGVKAAGGIRTAEQALALVAAGANRIGASKGADLVREWEAAGRPQPSRAPS